MRAQTRGLFACVVAPPLVPLHRDQPAPALFLSIAVRSAATPSVCFAQQAAGRRRRILRRITPWVQDKAGRDRSGAAIPVFKPLADSRCRAAATSVRLFRGKKKTTTGRCKRAAPYVAPFFSLFRRFFPQHLCPAFCCHLALEPHGPRLARGPSDVAS